MIRALGAADPLAGHSAKARRLAAAIRRAIATGRMLAGELLPSTRELGSTYGVHRQTAMTALQGLVAEGWILSEPRRGYRVAEVAPDSFFRAHGASAGRTNGKFIWRSARKCGLDALPGARVSLADAGADPRLFPVDELRACYALALRSGGRNALRAIDVDGHPRLVRALRTYLRRVRGVSGRELAITQGAQDALHSLAQLLLAPGDRVAVECPGYPPAWEAFRLAGAELVPIPVDGDGICIDALERAARTKAIRALYTTPLHQFPTTVTLARERRRALLRATARAGIAIIEDDYDHEYHYRSSPQAPLAAHDDAEHVIYVATLAKALFSSARVGVVAAEGGLMQRLTRLRRATLRASDGLSQLALALWIEDGCLERHMRRTRRTYTERRNAFVAALSDLIVTPRLGEFSIPDGGLAVWLEVRARSATAVAKEALTKGVLVLPEAPLRLEGGEDNHLRLGFASLTAGEATAPLRAVRDAIVAIAKGRPRG